MARSGGEVVVVRRVDPVTYSDDLAYAICDAIASTPRGIDYICATNKGFPHPRTVDRWLLENPEFRAQYEAAKLRQADLLFDQCLEIADDGSKDTMTVRRNDGREVETMDREYVERSKLKVMTRLKMVEKLNPWKYGPKLDLNAAMGFVRHEDALEQLR